MTAGLKAYPEMRDSGVGWLGEVPAHWEVLPGRTCFREKSNNLNVGLREKTVLSLSYGSIVVKPPEKLHGLVPASFETYQIVDPFDIVVRPTDLQNDRISLRLGLSRYRGIITSAYICLQTTGRLVREYGYLLLHTYDLMKIFYGLGSGLRQNLSWADFRYLPGLVPSVDEQTAIVRFLNHADRRIRHYIRAKERLIELLEEQRQAIIHEAVTGQIDVRTGQPYPAYKDSGVEWLGEVPEHWEVLRLGAILQERGELNGDGEMDEVLSVLRGRGVIPYSQKGNIGNKKSEDTTRYKIVRPDDIVVNSMNVIIGSVGLSRYTGCLSPVYYVLKTRTGCDRPRYLDACFQTKRFQRSLVRLGNGILAHRMRIPMVLLKCEPLPRPPHAEQTAIVRYLDDEAVKMVNTIARTRRQVDHMREYRTRLIADVVTGKLDVRKAAARLPDVDPVAGGGRGDDIYTESNPRASGHDTAEEASA